MSAHIAIPLTQGDESATEIYDATGILVADIDGYCTTPDQDANFAAFIVRACNAHDEMVKALGAAQSALRSFQYGNASVDLAKDMADNCAAVLAKALAK